MSPRELAALANNTLKMLRSLQVAHFTAQELIAHGHAVSAAILAKLAADAAVAAVAERRDPQGPA